MGSEHLTALATGLAGAILVCAEAGEAERAPAWEKFLAIRTFGGYKDNVLLSAEEVDGSPFIGFSFEGIAWGAAGVDGELQALFVGEHRHYLDAKNLDYEQTVLAQVQYQYYPTLEWTVRTPVEYLYIDQILDVSATEDVVQAQRVQGQTIAMRPALQRHWVPGTLEFEINGLRQLYAAPLDDSWELGGGLKWEQSVSDQIRWDIGYGFGQIWYDQEPDRTATGEAVPGTSRRMQRHDLALGLTREWGAQKDWRLSVRASGRYATDRGYGYYDYVRPVAVVKLRYRHGPWFVEGGLRFRHYHYLTQEIAEPGSPLRRRTELVAELRGEREVARWLRVFAELQHEQTFANRSSEEYSVNTLSAGLEISF